MTSTVLQEEGWRHYQHAVTKEDLPGKSEILDMLGGERVEGLMGYAARCASKGVDWRLDRQGKADTGTLAHLLIRQRLEGRKPTAPAECSSEMVGLAFTALEAFDRWRASRQPSVVALEVPLVCSRLGFGGTIDAVLSIGGRLYVVDWKTGSTHSEMAVGMAAYRFLWNLHSSATVTEAMIVRCPTDGSDAVEFVLDDATLTMGTRVFEALHEVYRVFPSIKLPTPTPWAEV